MTSEIDANRESSGLEKAGLAAGGAQAWLAAWPELRSDYDDDSRACSRFWTLGGKLRARLPKRTERNAAQAAASGFSGGAAPIPESGI